jgi:hypothetical protein
MKFFRIFLVCVVLSTLVQAEPIDPLKAYVSQLKTAHENDKVAIALLETLYHFLPDRTPQALKLKEQLAQEFEKKFRTSINEVNEGLMNEEQKGTFLVDAGIELAKYADQMIIQREANWVAQISYVLLSYALTKVNLAIENSEKFSEAQKTMLHLETKYPHVKTLSEQLKDTKTAEHLLAKLLSTSMSHQMQGCFAGICVSNKSGIITLLVWLGLPLAQFLYKWFKSTDMGMPNRDDDNESFAGGDDGNDPGNDDNPPAPPGPRGRQRRLQNAHRLADELDQQLTDVAGNASSESRDESSASSSAAVRATPPTTPSRSPRRSQGSLPGSPSVGARSPFVRAPGSRGTVDPVIPADDPRAVDARRRLLGGPVNWSH